MQGRSRYLACTYFANQLTDMQQYILKLESTYFCDLTDALDADGVPHP